jgi:hypothetical protein
MPTSVKAQFMIPILTIALWLPFTALGSATDTLKTIPAQTDWAVAFTDTSDIVDGLIPIYDQIAASAQIMPARDGIGELLKEHLGFNPLDGEELAAEGFDQARGLVIHGAINARLKKQQGITVSIAAHDAKRLDNLLARLFDKMSFRVQKTKRRYGTILTLRGAIAVATTPGWLHILIGQGEKVLESEARRVLRKTRRFGQSRAFSTLNPIVTGGQIATYVNMTTIANHEIQTLRRQMASLKRRIKRETNPQITTMWEHNVAAIADQIEEWESRKRVTAVSGRLSFRDKMTDALVYLQLSKNTLKRYRDALTPATGPGFSGDFLRKSNPLYAEFNASPAAVVEHLLTLNRDFRLSWEFMSNALQEKLNVDATSELLPLLTGPIVYVAHHIQVPKTSQLNTKESPVSPPTPATVSTDEEEGFGQANVDRSEDISSEVFWGKYFVGHLQQAVLVRVRDTQPFLRIAKQLEEKIRSKSGPNEPITVTTTNVDGVHYMSLRVGESIAPAGFYIHLGIGKNTVLLGSGPDLPNVAKPWFQEGAQTTEQLGHMRLNVTGMLVHIEALMAAVLTDDKNAASVKDEWKSMKVLLDLWSTMETSLSSAPDGYTIRCSVQRTK